MIGKLCAAPIGGGGASGLIEYLVGYAISDKGATRHEIADALDAVYAEAEQRHDLGADAIWAPAAGGGTRPSSILVRNCASFSTASLEIDADAARNPGVRSSAMHFVWSWNTRESGALTDEQVHKYVGDVLGKLNLGHHRSVSVVHRDTIVYERDIDGTVLRDESGNTIARDGNLHVHCAVGIVDPRLGLAFDRTGLHRRMAWAEREVELHHALDHDRGLAVVQDAGLSTAHVRWADKHELGAWRAQRREERLASLERRSFDGYRKRDVTFRRFVDATVAPRFRVALELESRRGRVPSWGTLHTVAARYGCALEVTDDGKVYVRDVGIGELRLEHERGRRDLRAMLKDQGVDAGEIDESLTALRSEHLRSEASERDLKIRNGETVLLEELLQDQPPAYQTIEGSESEIAARVKAAPTLVLQDVTAHSSTFTREDVDLWLASRITDPADIERLGDLVVRDDSVRVLNADTMQPLMTTTEVLAIEDRLREDAGALALSGSGIARVDIERAIAAHEAQESQRRSEAFRLSSEQRDALQQLSRGSLVAIEGLPGVGKTTIQGVVRVLGENTGREVVGLTLSQAAAERLESEAGFRCVNTARAQILEEGRKPVIPRDGIVVVDEAAMVDSRANGRILQLARERGSIVVEIGDLRQLQPIDFGASFRIVCDAARETDTYCELRDIQRQRLDWHREAVARLADAIAERDENKRTTMVRSALAVLDKHGAIAWVADREEAIDTAVSRSREHQANGRDTLTLASDKDTVRHLSEEDRRREGLEGRGRRFVTDGGSREFSAGDRLMFLENSLGARGLGVRNGDRGVVLQAKQDSIVVRMDGDARVVAFSPKAYPAFDYASACTVHKAQGASVDVAVSVIDRSASAELLFVAVSRSKHAVDVVVPRSAFNDLGDLAEHVAERVSRKTTTQNYDELLERTGGPDTMRVRNIDTRRDAAPLRRVYEADIVEPLRDLQSARVDAARQVYQERKSESAGAALPIEARLDANREALREMRRAVATAYRDLKPQPFADWLRERDEARDRTREAEMGRSQRSERQEQAQERGKDRSDGLFTSAERATREEERHIRR